MDPQVGMVSNANGDLNPPAFTPHQSSEPRSHVSVDDTGATNECVMPGLELASWCVDARRLRDAIFGTQMFSDPAWDILLCLYVLAAHGDKVKITSLAPMTGLATTTAGRWARKLVARGLLEREQDGSDRRRSYISLSHEGYVLVRRYFEELIQKRNFPQFPQG